MSDSPPESPPPASAAAQDVSSVARGSGVVFVGNVFNRALRLLNTWYLSGGLGVVGFGLYTSVTTVVTILSYLAPLGMNSGVVMYGARYRASGEKNRHKGALIACFSIALIAGPLISLGYMAVAWQWPTGGESAALGALLPWGAPAIAVWAVLLVAVAALRSYKDMRGETLVLNVTLPVLMVSLSVVAVVGGLGVEGALLGFAGAHLIALAYGLSALWRHAGGLLRDRAIKPRFEWGTLLRFSLPESLSFMLLRLTQWTDVLMLTALASSVDVGMYRVAASLAVAGTVPAAALQSVLAPTVAELVYLQEWKRLDAVVGVVTRWLIIVTTPVYLGLFLLQDVVYGIFDPAYAQSAPALSVLLMGQILYAVSAPVTTLIPMAGHSGLNLVNGVAAASLNAGLNYLLIPRMGFMGASVATAITLTAWSAWRVAQVWWLMKCAPFSGRSLVLIGVGGVMGYAARQLVADQGIGWHIAVATVVIAAYGAFAWVVGRTPEDDAVLAPALARVRKRLGR